MEMALELNSRGFEELSEQELFAVDGGGAAEAFAFTAGAVFFAIGGMLIIGGLIGLSPGAVAAGIGIATYGYSAMLTASRGR